MVPRTNARPVRLAPDALAQELARLPGWSEAGGALTRTFRFSGFPLAMAFMAAAAVDAERLDHHPDWRNLFDRVEVRLSTHDTADGAPGVTSLDLELARCMDALAEAIGRGGRGSPPT